MAYLSGATRSFNTTTGAWTPMKITGPAPVPRLGASFGYDPTGGDLVLFGGEYLPGGSVQPVALNDTWTLTVNTSTGAWTWAQKAAAPAGLMPREFAAVASATNSSVSGAVLFGGMGGSTGTNVNADQVLGDTWTWNGATSTWAPACTSCTVIPPPAIGAAIAYHHATVEDLLYGGYSGTGSPAAPSTTWIWKANWAAGQRLRVTRR